MRHAVNNREAPGGSRFDSGPRRVCFPCEVFVARTLVTRLLERIRDPKRLTDMGQLVKPVPFPPATEVALARAERSLGFALPALLRQVYAHVGNGGFGPAYGLIGVPGGAKDDLGRSIVDLYKD